MEDNVPADVRETTFLKPLDFSGRHSYSSLKETRTSVRCFSMKVRDA